MLSATLFLHLSLSIYISFDRLLLRKKEVYEVGDRMIDQWAAERVKTFFHTSTSAKKGKMNNWLSWDKAFVRLLMLIMYCFTGSLHLIGLLLFEYDILSRSTENSNSPARSVVRVRRWQVLIYISEVIGTDALADRIEISLWKWRHEKHNLAYEWYVTMQEISYGNWVNGVKNIFRLMKK